MARPSGSLYARGFAGDAESETALKAGLAGREVRIQRGRLPVALRMLAAEPSPRLVFVDIDGVSNPSAAARELVSVYAIGTALIAIGSTDTAHFARSLLRQGITDYLVKPLSAAVVRLVGRAPVRRVELGLRHRLVGRGPDEAHPLLAPIVEHAGRCQPAAGRRRASSGR